MLIARHSLRTALPWAVMLLLLVGSLFTHRYAYDRGRRQGELEAMYDDLALNTPKDLRVLIALLRPAGHRVSSDDRLTFRGWLKGALSFAEGMVIPMERERGHAERVAEVQRLLKEGRELDEALGPMYPDAETTGNDGAAE